MSTVDTELAAAERDLEAIQAKIAIPVDPVAAESFHELQRLADAGQLRKLQAATKRRDALRERASNAAASLEQHAAAESRAAKQLDKLNGELDKSARAVVAAVRDAESALERLLAASGEHDALVRQVAAQLRSEGLPLVDEYGSEYETGGDHPRSGAARLAGRWWMPIRADAVFMRVAWGTARAVLGDRSDLARRLNRYIDVDRLDSRPDGLLSAAPLKAPYQPPGRVVAHSAPVTSLAIVSDREREEHANRQKLEERKREYEEKARRERYAEARADLVRQRGEQYVVDLEAKLNA